MDISQIKQQIEAGERPATKIRRRTLIISELEAQGSQETPLNKQVENLETEMSLRNAQIADLQQKVLLADSDGRWKQRIDGITSIVETKCVIKVLMSELVSVKTACAKLESLITQEKDNAQDLRKTLSDERKVMSTMDTEHQQQLLEQEERHQEKVDYLLSQLQNKTICVEPEEPAPKEESSREKELLERLRAQEEELTLLREQNRSVVEQNEQFKQKFSLLQLASGKKILAPTVRNEQSTDDSFEYVPPKPKGRRFTTAKAPLNTTITVEELLSPTEEEESEEEEEWRPVKIEKRPSNTRKSKVNGCSCKGRCGTWLCRCRKSKTTCGENCQCDHEKCRNMEDKGHAAKDSSQTESALMERPVSPRDPESASPDNTTFFKPPTCTPTKKVLKEIVEMGQDAEDLIRRTSQEEEEDDEVDRTAATFLRKKKRLLTSFQNSFFSGCTPIREEN